MPIKNGVFLTRAQAIEFLDEGTRARLIGMKIRGGCPYSVKHLTTGLRKLTVGREQVCGPYASLKTKPSVPKAEHRHVAISIVGVDNSFGYVDFSDGGSVSSQIRKQFRKIVVMCNLIPPECRGPGGIVDMTQKYYGVKDGIETHYAASFGMRNGLLLKQSEACVILSQDILKNCATEKFSNAFPELFADDGGTFQNAQTHAKFGCYQDFEYFKAAQKRTSAYHDLLVAGNFILDALEPIFEGNPIGSAFIPGLSHAGIEIDQNQIHRSIQWPSYSTCILLKQIMSVSMLCQCILTNPIDAIRIHAWNDTKYWRNLKTETLRKLSALKYGRKEKV